MRNCHHKKSYFTLSSLFLHRFPLLLILLLLLLTAPLLLTGCGNTAGDDPDAVYTLSYTCEPADAGKILGESSFTLSAGETGGYVTAQAEKGYVFQKWSDGSTDPNRGGESVTGDTEIKAIFTPRAYTLKYTSSTPVGGMIYGETDQSLYAGDKSTEVTAVPSAYYSFAGWSDGVKDYTRSGDTVTEDTEIQALFTHDPIDISIASLYITTDSGSPVHDKTEWVGASLTVTGSEGGKYDLSDARMTIKGRGNSSWSSSAAFQLDDHKSKNSYTIRLDEKTHLLGVGRAPVHKYVLNANKFDESGLRNWICFRMGELLSGVPYSSDMTWVDLYINGNYRGMYTLCEKVAAGKNRINIESEDMSVLDRGYLVQLDKRAVGTEGVGLFYVDGYYGDNDPNTPRPFVVENGETTPEQIKYIKDYIESCHQAILSGDRELIEHLVDMDSFVDMFLVTELSKDVDANFASFYMYKAPGGKLTLTSPWDFDFGFGSYSSSISIEDLMAEKKTGNLWFKNLLKYDWFCEAIVDRMKEVTPIVFQVRDELYAMEDALTP